MTTFLLVLLVVVLSAMVGVCIGMMLSTREWMNDMQADIDAIRAAVEPPSVTDMPAVPAPNRGHFDDVS